MLRPARCYQHDDAGPRPARIAAAELVGGRTRRPNVYDKKSQRYAKDNRTAFNCTVARNDKSVAYAGTPARMGQGGRSPHLPRRWWGEVGRASAPLVN